MTGAVLLKLASNYNAIEIIDEIFTAVLLNLFKVATKLFFVGFQEILR